jgi:predicted short-subunit dehydrogenase-like oxidoreductase (DUF2520 family)
MRWLSFDAAMDLELGPLRFGIIGAGRLGRTLARALASSGLDVVHASSATADGRAQAVRQLEVPVHDDPLAVTEQVDCVLLCVPDDALAGVVAHLLQRSTEASPIRLRIVSTSAHGGTAALAPLAAAGHAVGVLHPVASVGDDSGDPAAILGAGAAIGAEDDVERTFLHALAHALGMLPFDVAPEAWALHAAACTLAANGTGALLAAVEELASDAGIHPGIARSAYGRLAGFAVARAQHDGPIQSLAGPVLRGDAAAVAAQVRAVRDASGEVDALFIPVVATVANRAFTSGRIDMQMHRELLEAVLDPTQFDDQGFRYRGTDEPGEDAS